MFLFQTSLRVPATEHGIINTLAPLRQKNGPNIPYQNKRLMIFLRTFTPSFPEGAHSIAPQLDACTGYGIVLGPLAMCRKPRCASFSVQYLSLRLHSRRCGKQGRVVVGHTYYAVDRIRYDPLGCAKCALIRSTMVLGSSNLSSISI